MFAFTEFVNWSLPMFTPHVFYLLNNWFWRQSTDTENLIYGKAQFNLWKSLNDGLYLDWYYQLLTKKVKKRHTRTNILGCFTFYKNLLYCNVNDCLMTRTHWWKISVLWQKEMMLHDKYFCSDFIFPFRFLMFVKPKIT